MEQPLAQELNSTSEKELSKLEFKPVIVKNRELMAPGTWNDTDYSAKQIHDAFLNTNWEDKDTISLFLDHKDKETSEWVGWIKNQREDGYGKVFGDLELWDEDIARKLTLAKAKFGISPKIKGQDVGNRLTNFTFENFSIVTRPAVRTAYINLISKKNKGGKMVEKYLEEEAKDETKEEIKEEVAETKEESKPEEKTVEEVKEVKTEETKEGPKEELAEDKEEESPEEKEKKKKLPPEEEELNEDELLEITQLSAWTDFVKKMKKKYPKMSFKAIAKAFKSQKEASAELEELSDEELVEKIDSLMAVLKRRKKYPEAEEDEDKKEMKDLRETVKKLSIKIEEPDRKSVTLSAAHETEGVAPTIATPVSNGVTGMADFLINNSGKGGRIF